MNFNKIKFASVSITLKDGFIKDLIAKSLFKKLLDIDFLIHVLFFNDSSAAMHDSLETLNGFLNEYNLSIIFLFDLSENLIL